MAYAAVFSLEQIIDRLLNSSHISVAQNSSPQIMELLYKEVRFLREALREFNARRSTVNMKMVKTLEAEIIDVVHKFEDVIEFHVADQFHSQSEEKEQEEEEETNNPPLMLFSVDVQEIKQDIDSFIETANKMNKAYVHELCNPSPEENEDDCAVRSRIAFDGNESNMVGLSDLFMRIKDWLGQNSSQSKGMIVILCGMAGIGKTTLAKKLFHEPSIASHFTRRVFVKIGPKYRLVDILVDILKQLNPGIEETNILNGDELVLLAELENMVYQSLKKLRYLIVLDDVWNRELCSELTKLFPEDNNGSRVLLTTRLQQIAEWKKYNIPFLNKKESWDLLRQKVLGEESCSYGLERAGKKIAENCEGLPLTIITVAGILSKAEKTTEYWNKVADDKQDSVYKDAYDQMSTTLYPSYDYLDQHLKACFLYLGAFPQNHMILLYDVINLWSVEGFRDSETATYPGMVTTFTDGASYYLFELYSQNVVMYDEKICGYRLHSSFWYLCNKEAVETKFFYALNGLVDGLSKDIKNQRRLSIRNSILFAIKDVRDSIAQVSTVRTLLCSGPYHPYPVPMNLEHLRLLKVLEARMIFIEFPMEVAKLFQLKYLYIVYDRIIPPSISKLSNLEYLIVDRHLSIKKYDETLSYLPIEIWKMKELKSLQILGRDLACPCEGSLLPNLVQLIGVSHQSCTKDVFEKIPNLELLMIRVELAPDACEPLGIFDHISHLPQLKILNCAIANPAFLTEVVIPLAPLSDLPSSLTKLTLSGLGYKWEEMSKISVLPNLKYLKLECFAFKGPTWEVHDNEFQRLMSLSIEDNDVEHWTFQSYSCMPMLMLVDIVHCYKLKAIPVTTFNTLLNEIEIVDCDPMVVRCAKNLKRDWDDKHGEESSLVLNVRSSWDDGSIHA